MVLINKKEQTTGTCDIKDGLQKHYVKWTKPDTKQYI